MKRLIQSFMALFVVLLPIMATAQQRVTVRELNTYENLTDESQIANHPLIGTEVTFTGVVVSYPKSSGQASYTDGEPTGTISRIHIFVVDTTAASMGKEGMYLQIVEEGGSNPGTNDYAYSLENLNVGDIVDFTGRTSERFNVIQFDVTQYDVSASESNFVGNVNDSGFERYIPLLDPIEVTIDQLNIDNGDGTSFINLDNYSKYVSAYVKINGAVVSGRFEDQAGNRPYYAMTQNSTNLMSSGLSLRYRNDRTDDYREGYNFRRASEGNFVPPVNGSVLEISGFVVAGAFGGALNRITEGRDLFAIAPFEDGALWINDMLSGTEWIDDLTVLGIAPTLTSLNQSITENIGPDSVVTVSIDVTSNQQPDDTTPTIDEVSLIYKANITDTLMMTVTSGNTYSVDLPKFPNFTPVTYTIEAKASNDLVGRYPDFGVESFFVADGTIDSISVIQKTDSPEGLSSLANSGSFAMNIKAIVVSDDDDGVIVVHDKADKWGGIFLESTSSTQALSRGDSINITSASVAELAPSSGGGGIFLTVLQDLEFTTLSSGNDIEVAIPSLFTSDFIALESGDEIEEYEGMVVKFENVMYVDLGSFGEFELANKKPSEVDFPTSGAKFNDDLNGGTIGETDFPGDFNVHLRDSAMFDAAYGVVAASFGDPLVHARGSSDFVGNDNYTIPQLDFNLLTPEDSAEVVASGDVEISWQASSDYDGNDVTYEWVLYSAVDTTEVLALTSNTEGTSAALTIPYDNVDAFLESAGLQVGDSKDYVWNVKISDGSDTLNVAFYSFRDAAFVNVYNHLTLTRSLQTSNDVETGTPVAFKLEQNYPNPFNPTTNIKFSLPKTTNVSLTIYNMLGQKVSTLINEKMNSGFHIIPFDASNLASGMYIYRIEAGSFTSIKKMLLIK